MPLDDEVAALATYCRLAVDCKIQLQVLAPIIRIRWNDWTSDELSATSITSASDVLDYLN